MENMLSMNVYLFHKIGLRIFFFLNEIFNLQNLSLTARDIISFCFLEAMAFDSFWYIICI